MMVLKVFLDKLTATDDDVGSGKMSASDMLKKINNSTQAQKNLLKVGKTLSIFKDLLPVDILKVTDNVRFLQFKQYFG